MAMSPVHVSPGHIQGHVPDIPGPSPPLMISLRPSTTTASIQQINPSTRQNKLYIYLKTHIFHFHKFDDFDLEWAERGGSQGGNSRDVFAGTDDE